MNICKILNNNILYASSRKLFMVNFYDQKALLYSEGTRPVPIRGHLRNRAFHRIMKILLYSEITSLWPNGGFDENKLGKSSAFLGIFFFNRKTDLSSR